MFRIFFKRNFGISLLVFLSLLIILNNFFRFFQNKTLYQFLPWLSNYQGGFTRRGLPGEIFFQIHDLFNIHLGWMVFLFVCFLYLIFYFTFFYLIKKIQLEKLLILAIFSPIALYFPVLNSKATGHKEIIFLCLLALFCCLVPKIKKNYENILMILITSLAVLSHDGLIFYLTYLVIPFVIFFKFENYKELFLDLLPITFITILLAFIIYIFKGTEQHVNAICDSVKLYVDPGCREAGQIAFLKHSIEYNILSRGAAEIEGNLVFQEYFRIYGLGFIIGFFPLIILYGKSKLVLPIVSKKIHSQFILFFPLIMSAPIYYMAADWGRYLYISYISSLIILIFGLSNEIFAKEKSKNENNESMIKKILFSLIIFVYCLGWTVPICCEKNFKSGIYDFFKRTAYYMEMKN